MSQWSDTHTSRLNPPFNPCLDQRQPSRLILQNEMPYDVIMEKDRLCSASVCLTPASPHPSRLPAREHVVPCVASLALGVSRKRHFEWKTSGWNTDVLALQNPAWVFHISHCRLHRTTLRPFRGEGEGEKNSFMADFLLTFDATPPLFVSRLFMVSYCLLVLLPICLLLKVFADRRPRWSGQTIVFRGKLSACSVLKVS